MMDFSLEELMAEKARRQQASSAPPENIEHNNQANTFGLEELLAEKKRRINANSTNKAEDFSWPRFLGEQFTKGVFSVADFGEMIGTLGGLIGDKKQPISKRTKEALKQVYELDLDSQGEGSTPAQKVFGKAANFAGGSVIPGGGLLKGMLVGAGVGGAAGGLNALGVPEAIADLTAVAGGIVTPGIVNKIKNRKTVISPQEEKVAKTLQDLAGEAEKQNVVNNLENVSNYNGIPDYQPMTAEVANNPSIAQIHRARESIPGSGIADKSAQQNKTIMDKFDEHSFKASTTEEIKNAISNELVKRETARREATQAGYSAVEKMNEKVTPNELLNFIKEKPAAGTIKKDLNAILKDINTREGTKISQLAAIDVDLGAKIEKLRSSGQRNRAKILRQAQEALRKDLDIVDSYKEAREAYKNLSQPVNEIVKHPNLKNIPKSRANNLMGKIYDQSSFDNVTQLKKVLGNNPSEWEGIQHATTDYIKKKIMNSSAEGGGRVLSYNKLNKFTQDHRKALEVVYDKNQLEFLDTLESVLSGQNKAKTLGKGVGSDTQGKQAIDEMLKEGLVIKGLNKISKGTSYLPMIGNKVSFGLLSGLEWYSKNNQSKLVSILDKALTSPEYAEKLLSSEFRNRRDWVDFINSTSKTGITSAVFRDKENN